MQLAAARGRMGTGLRRSAGRVRLRWPEVALWRDCRAVATAGPQTAVALEEPLRHPGTRAGVIRAGFDIIVYDTMNYDRFLDSVLN